MKKQNIQDGVSKTGLSQFTPYLMNRIMHRYNQGLQAEFAPAGLSVSKMRALAALAAMGKLTVNELAIYAVAEQSTMSRTVDQMEKDGLISRAISEKDSRVRVVTLSEAGQDTYREMWPKMQAAEANMLDGLDDETRAQFIETLNQVLRNIRHNDF